MKKKSLIIGHPLVIDANRKFWSVFSKVNNVDVDLVCPKKWRSNLIKELSYSFNSQIDSAFSNVIPVDCYLRGNGSLFFYNQFKILKILAKKYDYIFINQEGWSLSFTLIRSFLWLTANRDTPVFITAAQNIKKRDWQWMHPFEQWNCEKLQGIFFCSDGVKEVLEWKKLPPPFYYLPLSFDEDDYQSYKKRDFSSLESRDLGKTTPLRIGYLGRLSEDKGVLCLLEAVKKLKQLGHNIELIIAGAGPLEKLVKEQADQFLGVIAHHEAFQFYQKIDLFVLASLTYPHWKEQFGRVLVEAAAAGCIVVGSNSGSIPEVLGKLEQPNIFKEGNSNSLVHCVESVLQMASGGELNRIVKNSQQKSFELFSHCSVSKYLYRIWVENS